MLHQHNSNSSILKIFLNSVFWNWFHAIVNLCTCHCVTTVTLTVKIQTITWVLKFTSKDFYGSNVYLPTEIQITLNEISNSIKSDSIVNLVEGSSFRKKQVECEKKLKRYMRGKKALKMIPYFLTLIWSSCKYNCNHFQRKKKIHLNCKICKTQTHTYIKKRRNYESKIVFLIHRYLRYLQK